MARPLHSLQAWTTLRQAFQRDLQDLLSRSPLLMEDNQLACPKPQTVKAEAQLLLLFILLVSPVPVFFHVS
jgi:hypothetical protein